MHCKLLNFIEYDLFLPSPVVCLVGTQYDKGLPITNQIEKRIETGIENYLTIFKKVKVESLLMLESSVVMIKKTQCVYWYMYLRFTEEQATSCV